ncbi:hypothetical protein TgHK011_008917 [Trichoderma gracile]|nr:hypothetical protein TgHK011_008917 [Trichoderma gracile]
MASSPLQPSTKLQHRGNTYSHLTSKQQTELYAQLPLQCHSLETLKRSGVLLNIDPHPEASTKKQGLDMADFLPTPSPSPAVPKRKAIVITCQAAQTQDGGGEPVSICVVDFFTGQTLMDSFVAPPCEISDWKTDVHGICAKTIETAVKGNNCLQSWREARMRLFEYVDAQTILVGCAIGKELEMLRVFHRGVVDVRLLATEALFTVAERAKGGMQLELGVDGVCMGLLGMEIRGVAMMGKRVRDAYEDVLVVREIMLWFLQRPGDVMEWVKRERLDMFGPALKGEEEAVGKSARRPGRGPKRTGQKGASNDKQRANKRTKKDGNRRQIQAEALKDSVVQSLKEVNIGEALQGRRDGEQKAVEAAVGDAGHVENQSKNKEKSGNGKARSRTRKEKKKMETEAQEKAKREASLKAMVREEERNLSTRGNGKQGARTDWETRDRAERRAKWVDSQRDM